MKRIAFYDNGPGHKFEGVYSGGDIIEVEDHVADAYINTLLAFEVRNKTDENKAQGIKEQVERNIKRREIVPKADPDKVETLREKYKERGVTVE